MDSILNNPLAYAHKTRLEQQRREPFPQFTISAAYALAVNAFPLLPGIADKPQLVQFNNEQRANFFYAILTGYDLGNGRNSIAEVLKELLPEDKTARYWADYNGTTLYSQIKDATVIDARPLTAPEAQHLNQLEKRRGSPIRWVIATGIL